MSAVTSHAITDGALDGKSSAIDLRLDVLDDDAAGDGRLDGAVSFARHSRYRPPSIEFQAIG